MRIRQIKPSWFLDKDLQTRVRADTREFYIGLWMQADDEGWFEWDVTRIGAELFPFIGVARRERDVVRQAELLEGLTPEHPHLIRHSCGHAEVPKMAPHQRVSSARKVTGDHDRHEKHHCPAHPRGHPRHPAEGTPGKERERVEVGNGTEKVNAREAQTDFQREMDRNGSLVSGRSAA